MSDGPLDLREQWAVLKYAALMDGSRMKATTLLVLIRLLDHQNPKTGQCNPSTARLQSDLRMSRRSVQNATAELCHLGFLRKISKRNATNSYVFRKPSELAEVVQSPALRGAKRCAFVAQQSAPKKEKEKEKEKAIDPQVGPNNKHSAKNNNKQQQEAERAIVAALEGLGFTYVDLLRLSTQLLTSTCEQVSIGALQPDEAAEQLSIEIRRFVNHASSP